MTAPKPPLAIFKVTAMGDVLYIQAVNQQAAANRLREMMGDIPAAILKWSVVNEIPEGEELL